jgi:hypothetical protein
MDTNRLSLSKLDKYWLYILNGNNVSDFTNYDKPYFTIPNNEKIMNSEFSTGDIIILILSNKKCYSFIGFVQLGSDVIINNNKIRIFKDDILNANYVTLKFRLICNDNVKLASVLKDLDFDNEAFKSTSKFMSKYIKKHFIMTAFPPVEGKIIIKHLIELNEKEESEDSYEEDEDGDGDEEEEEGEDEDGEEKEEERGMIPIMIIPCSDFSIDQQKNKLAYFLNHYKKCVKCDIINNNRIELHTIINDCKLEFKEIKDNKNAYFIPALDQYNCGMNYEPIDNEEFPFVRVLYINNKHLIYDKCVLVAWILNY